MTDASVIFPCIIPPLHSGFFNYPTVLPYVFTLEISPIISFEDNRRICHFPPGTAVCIYHPTTSQTSQRISYFPTVLPYVFTLEISPIISFEDDKCICHFLADSEEPGTLSAFRAHCVRMFREFFPIISLEDDRRICHLRRYCIIPFHYGNVTVYRYRPGYDAASAG